MKKMTREEWRAVVMEGTRTAKLERNIPLLAVVQGGEYCIPTIHSYLERLRSSFCVKP
jgi:hypothetical protein